jgi:hypothetical protein
VPRLDFSRAAGWFRTWSLAATFRPGTASYWIGAKLVCARFLVHGF